MQRVPQVPLTGQGRLAVDGCHLWVPGMRNRDIADFRPFCGAPEVPVKDVDGIHGDGS